HSLHLALPVGKLHRPARGAGDMAGSRGIRSHIYRIDTNWRAVVDTAPRGSNMVVEFRHWGRIRPSSSVTCHGSRIARRSSSDAKSSSVKGTVVASGGGVSV